MTKLTRYWKINDQIDTIKIIGIKLKYNILDSDQKHNFTFFLYIYIYIYKLWLTERFLCIVILRKVCFYLLWDHLNVLSPAIDNLSTKFIMNKTLLHLLRYCSLTRQIQNTFYSLSHPHKLTEMEDNDWLTIQWHVVDAVNVELGNDGLKANSYLDREKLIFKWNVIDYWA